MNQHEQMRSKKVNQDANGKFVLNRADVVKDVGVIFRRKYITKFNNYIMLQI